jgi:outer membrane protein TolC
MGAWDERALRGAIAAAWALFMMVFATSADAQPATPRAEPLRLVDAVMTAIARHPALEIQQQEIEIGTGLQREAAGAFDQVFEASFDHGRSYSPAAQLDGFGLSPSDASNVVASYSKRLRNGVSVAGSLDLRRQIDGAAIQQGLSTSSTRFQLVIPLMRGRGTAANTAAERAAGTQREGSTFDLRHVTAQLMSNVVSSYWGLVAAERSREVALRSVERGARLVENTRALVAADQTPQSELAPVLANVADRQAARFVAEQTYIRARQQLLLDMGDPIAEARPLAGLDDFSLLKELPQAGQLSASGEPFVGGALERRADYLAAQARIEAARTTRDGAVNGLLPQVDLAVNVGHTALAEGRALGNYVSAVGAGPNGANVVGQITYRLPVRNSAASGRLLQADAQLRQATLTRDDLARTIRSSVLASYSALRNALAGLEQARASVEAFDEALRGEQDKLGLGIGSVINVLTIEDRLMAAAEREVDAWRSYGQALIEFRFATGTLVPAKEAVPALDVRTFTTFPFAQTAGR